MNSLVPIRPEARYVPLWPEDAPPAAVSERLRRRMRLSGVLLGAMILAATLVPIGGAIIASGRVQSRSLHSAPSTSPPASAR